MYLNSFRSKVQPSQTGNLFKNANYGTWVLFEWNLHVKLWYKKVLPNIHQGTVIGAEDYVGFIPSRSYKAMRNLNKECTRIINMLCVALGFPQVPGVHPADTVHALKFLSHFPTPQLVEWGYFFLPLLHAPFAYYPNISALPQKSVPLYSG